MAKNDWAVAKNVFWREQKIPLKGGDGEIKMSLFTKYDAEELIEGLSLREGCHKSNIVIEHKPFCNGTMDFILISNEKNVLHCKSCGLRIDVPMYIDTVGELVVYLIVHHK